MPNPVAFFVVSHGGMAEALVHSAERILPVDERRILRALSLDWGTKQDEIRRRVEAEAATLPDQAALILLVDVVGGTPWNALAEWASTHDAGLVGGVNLPMLLRLGCGTPCSGEGIEALVNWCVEKGRLGICAVDCDCAKPKTSDLQPSTSGSSPSRSGAN